MKKWHGAQVPNVDFMTDADYALIDRMDANALKIMPPVNPPRMIEEIRHRTGIERYVLRYFHHHQPPDPHVYFADVKRELACAFDILDGCQIFVQLANEPNHVDGVDGFGAYRLAEFCLWYGQVAQLALEEGWGLVFPGLAPSHPNHQAWLRALPFWMNACQATGAHSYSQGDNHLNPAWGLYHEQVAAVTDNPVLILEMGDTSFENPAAFHPEERSIRVYNWIRHVRNNDQVMGWFWFLIDGENRTPWHQHSLDEDTATAMVNALHSAPSL